MDTEKIQIVCDQYLEYLRSDEYHNDNDWIHFIYEDVMRAVYGADIFDRIREIHKQKSIRKKRAEIAKLQSEIGDASS